MLTSEIQYPVSDRMLVPKACAPDTPVARDDSRYYDLNALRGNDLVTEVAKSLKSAVTTGDYHHRCFCGHRGSGKSTELLAVRQAAEADGFLSIVVEVDIELGISKVEFSDLYLLAAKLVEEACQAVGRPLPAKKIDQVFDWFAEVTFEDKKTIKSELGIQAGMEVGGGVPLLGKLFAKFFAKAQAGSEHAQTAKRMFRDSPQTLIDMTNELLRAAADAVRNIKPRGVLLIFDNLDRSDREDIYAILSSGRGLLQKMACHAIYTVPINVVYQAPDPAQNCFGNPPFVLPVAPIRKPGIPWSRTIAETEFDEGNVDKLLEALSKRIDLALFENPADARLLVKMSGGHVRDLMHLVNAAWHKSVDRFTSEAVRKGIAEYRYIFSVRIEDADYPVLAAIARGERISNARVWNCLYQRYALEYLAPDGSRWRDLHPLLLESKAMQDALFGN